MPAPRFVTSDNFGAPGLYIQELRPSPIVSGKLNYGTGIAGVCVRGPKDRVIEVNSPARFLEVFGGRDYGAGGAIVGEIWKALLNKQFGKLFIVRAVAAAAVKASFTWETAAAGGGTAVLRIDASSEGIWGNDVKFKVSDASDGDANKWNLTIKYLGRVVKYENLNISSTNDNLAATVGTDDGRLVDLVKVAAGRPVNTAATVDGADADAFVNLGETVAAFTSVEGDDGVIDDSDFTASGRAIAVLAAYKGVGGPGHVFVAGRSNAAIRSALLTKAAASNDREFLMCPDSNSVTKDTWITEAASLRDDRVALEFNHPTTLDPETGETITVEPHSWAASILAQTDADVHLGDIDNKQFLAGITGLTYALEDGDYDDLDAAGINALERHHSGGFVFVSGVSSDLTTNNRQLDGRRTKDLLISGISGRLEGSNKKPNTAKRRAADKKAIEAWLIDLAKAERYVALDENGRPDFVVRNELDANTKAGWAQGIQKTFVQVRTIPQNLIAKLEFEGGPAVTVTKVTES